MNHRRLRLVLILLVAARIAMSVGSGAGMFWDFITFYSAGSRMAHGQTASLYQPPPPALAGERPLGAGVFEYVGFPISAIAFFPLGLLPPRWALALLKVLCVACSVVGLSIFYRHCRDRVGGVWRSDAGLSLYLGLVLCFEPIWFVFPIGGQATPLVFALMALVVAAYTDGRFLIAAASLSIAMLFKPILSLMVVAFVMARAWPLLLRLSGCLAVEIVVSCLVFGVERHLEWLRVVVRESARWAVPWWNNASVLSAAANLWIYDGAPRFDLNPPSAFLMTQVSYRVAVTALFLWLMMRDPGVHWSTAERRQRQVLLAVLLPLFVSTVVWPHYLAFAFFPLVVLLARYRQLPWPAQALVASALLASVRSNRYVFAWLDASIAPHTPQQGLLAGVIGGGTLGLLLVVVALFSDRFRAIDLTGTRC